MQPINIIERIVNAPTGSALAEAMQQRAEILRLSQASHDAVVVPKEPGDLSHGERAALAERITKLNGADELAEHYRACLENAGADETLLAIADPARDVDAGVRMNAIVRFTDLVTVRPREATRSDLEALKTVGMSDADIVRLTELLAFVNYQLRVVAGFKLAGSVR
ncbi:CMD domain-containing protein [Rhizobium anhuiense]|uniref:CMD domain-containing protein n=1 Tax=Rhizobium anhuiense TaxID=1184720 RepID=UPI003CC93309